MTEKRLIVRDGDYAWIDTVTDTLIEVEDAFDLVNNLAEENGQLYELIDFANTLIAFKTSESCQKEWKKRLNELQEWNMKR